MFDSVEFGGSEVAASKALFVQALPPLGLAIGSERPAPLHLAFVTVPGRHTIEAVGHAPAG